MENTELNNVAEEIVEASADVAENVVKESFVDRHPYLATVGTGVLLGTGLYTGAILVRATVKGGKILFGKIKNSIAARKEAKAQQEVLDNSNME